MYYFRTLESEIKKSLRSGKVVILFGARQTGKTTLLSQFANKASVRILLQDTKTRLKYSRDPALFRQELEARTEKKLIVFIDEIQKTPALLDDVQYLYDSHKNKFQFIITGSSSRKLKEASYNLLPGRAHVYHLDPVTQVERGVKSLLGKKASAPKNYFPQIPLNDLLLFGSLPGISLEKKTSKAKTLDAYSELYLEEEIRRESLVKDIGHFAQFLQLAALESGHPINLSKLSMETGVSVTTIKNYYQILEDTYIGYPLMPYTHNVRKRLLSTPKFYFFDTGVRNACARFSFSTDLLATQAGHLFEHWVANELVHRLRALGRAYRLFYYRTISGVEIDFIVKTPNEVIPIEIKWSDRPTLKDAKHLLQFLDEHPEVKRAWIICRCDMPLKLSEKITAYPWSML